MDCLDGFGTCHQSLPTKTQASQIADQNRDQNLWACLTGHGECDHSILTETKSTQVGRAEQRRNLPVTDYCEESQLKAADAKGGGPSQTAAG